MTLKQKIFLKIESCEAFLLYFVIPSYLFYFLRKLIRHISRLHQ